MEPTIEAMEAMAARSLAALPTQFLEHMDGVLVRIQDFADDEMLRSVDLQDRWELSGLYTGRPLDERSVWESGQLPDTIHLFRRPIIAEARDGDIPIETLVHHVLIHEIGHLFGLSDDDMHALEDETP